MIFIFYYILGLISVVSSLNRETNSEFTLLVVATDTGGRTGTGTVLITVTDANTQDPDFSASLYQATISESSPVDTFVLQVRDNCDTYDTLYHSIPLVPFELILSDFLYSNSSNL